MAISLDLVNISQKLCSVGQEDLEEEDAEVIVSEMELIRVDDGGLYGVCEDMPEDLSVKKRNTSVQTDTCPREKFWQILGGLPQKEIMSFMNVLAQIISMERNKGCENEFEECFMKLEQLAYLCFVIFIIHIIFQNSILANREEGKSLDPKTTQNIPIIFPPPPHRIIPIIWQAGVMPDGQRRVAEQSGGQRRVTEQNGCQMRVTEQNVGQRRVAEQNKLENSPNETEQVDVL